MQNKSPRNPVFQKRLVVLQKNIDGALFINISENVGWLSGFKGNDGFLFVTRAKSVFIIDKRYQGQVETEIDSCFSIVYIEKNLSDTLTTLLNDAGFSSLTIEDEGFTVGGFNQFKSLMDGFKFKPLPSIVTKSREQKDYFEIGKIREALRITEEAMAYIVSFVKPGMQEREVATELEYYCSLKGSEGVAFETIVASGLRSTIPHGTASNKIIERDELVLFDFGVTIEGYCSDFTRVIYTGANISADLFNLWKQVKKAHDLGIESIKTGNLIAKSDELVRDYFSKNSVLDNYLHSLGHGVGLKIHEAPSLSYKTEGKFKEGMVVTVEPGLYKAEIGGIRLEDMVLVGKKGCEILTDFPLDIALIG